MWKQISETREQLITDDFETVAVFRENCVSPRLGWKRKAYTVRRIETTPMFGGRIEAKYGEIIASWSEDYR